ncbi:MAG: hypothetical protein JWO05_3032 [Gemmatimonadetes bacterium]|nr:hypothetical protein [Gemmatimonadota bacterium]
MALRVLFVNTGIMGHASAARLIREAAALDPSLEATHVDLASDLALRERVVRKLLTMGPGPSSPWGTLAGSRYRHEMDSGARAARRIRALERAGRQFDVIHFHTQAAAWRSLDRMQATPSIVSIDATQRLLRSNAAPGLVQRGYDPGERRDAEVFRAARAIVATSRWAAGDVMQDVPSQSAKVHVLPYPVSLDGFDAGWAAERARRDRQQAVQVLFIGGLFGEKGGHDLLEAWRALAPGPRATLTIVTDSGEVDTGALPAGVTLRRGVRARTPEWIALWREADVFVLPTRVDAFGIVFQEAAAAGLPSIGTRINAVPELVVEGETGLLVPPADVTALRDALRQMVDDPALRARMGASARQRAETSGSMETFSRALSALLHHAATGTRTIGHSEAYRARSPVEQVVARVAAAIPEGALRRGVRGAFRSLMGLATGGRGIRAVLPRGEVVRLLPEYRHVTWNPAEYEAFRAVARPGDVALDVGANAGAYALVLGQWVQPGGRVFAFEPAAETFRGLAHHIRINALQSVVTPVQAAVAGFTGDAMLTMDGISGENRLVSGTRGTPVQAITIDDFCRRETVRPTFIKVDVEGSELEVLRGARETIRTCGDSLALFVEMHPAAWRGMGISRQDIEDELALQGLRAEALTDVPDPWALEGECLRLRRIGGEGAAS